MTSKTSRILGFEHYVPKKWHSSTSVCYASACARKYFYAEGLRLVKKGPKPWFKFGEGMHYAVPILHEEEFEHEVSKLIEASEAFHKIWTQEIEDTLSDSKRNWHRALATLRNYRTYHKPGASLYTLIKPPSTGLELLEPKSPYEVPFVVDLGLSKPLVGWVDALGEHRDTKELWVIEFKTSSELGQRFGNSWEMNLQTLVYQLGVSQYLPQPVAGCMIEGILVAKVSVNCMTIPIPRSDVLLKSLIEDIKDIDESIKRWEDRALFPKRLSACNPYGHFGQHGYNCDYAPLCACEDWRHLSDLYDQEPQRNFLKESSDEPMAPVPGAGQPAATSDNARDEAKDS